VTVALVTGGAGGLGVDIVARLVADGFTVVVVDADEAGLEALAAAQPGVAVVAGDLGTVATIDASVVEARDRVGPIGVLVNNAAIYPTTPFLEISPDEYDRVVAVNQRAYFRLAQLAASDMIAAGGGAIVNIASITISGGWPLLASYVSTKGAAVTLTRALARELGPHGIRVNAVAPGAFPTAAEEIHPDPEAYTQFVLDHQSLKRRGTAAEMAAVVSFLAGPDAAFVTGQTIHVNGGWVMS
jgi:NAD(P)-dependent dehydrogenase (short-subunit alcohol dehydrogenase family)